MSNCRSILWWQRSAFSFLFRMCQMIDGNQRSSYRKCLKRIDWWMVSVKTLTWINIIKDLPPSWKTTFSHSVRSRFTFCSFFFLCDCSTRSLSFLLVQLKAFIFLIFCKDLTRNSYKSIYSSEYYIRNDHLTTYSHPAFGILGMKTEI